MSFDKQYMQHIAIKMYHSQNVSAVFLKTALGETCYTKVLHCQGFERVSNAV